MIISMRTLIIFYISILSLFANTAFAQINSNALNPELGITLQPSNPQPGETTVATLNDSSGGAYGASVNWFIDDKEIADSNNQRSITFTATEDGSQNIKAVLTKPIGGTQVIQQTIKPAYLDIIIEAQTRVPDFYLGRALPSIGSTVNATALISGNGFRNNDLVYIWKVNNKVIDGGAMRGKDQVSFITPRGGQISLSVQITELNGTVIASRNIILPSVEPEMHFYEVSSLFGISEKAIKDQLKLSGNSTTIKAEPYYLDINVYNNPNIDEWSISSGQFQRVGSNPYEVSIQSGGIFNQNTELSFHVRDTKQVLQGIEGSMKINF